MYHGVCIGLRESVLRFAALLIGPVAAAIVFFGDSAVIVGLWPAHFVWTYCCVLKYANFSPTFTMPDSLSYFFFAPMMHEHFLSPQCLNV